MQKPCKVLAAASDPKLLTSAAQKQDTASPSVVARYIGRLPTFTARVLQMRLLAAMDTMQEPLQPSVKRWSGTPNSFARGTNAGVSKGPTAMMISSVATEGWLLRTSNTAAPVSDHDREELFLPAGPVVWIVRGIGWLWYKHNLAC